MEARTTKAVKVITVVLSLVIGLFIISDMAHADFVSSKCAMCHGADAKSGMAKIDLTAATIDLKKCTDAATNGVKATDGKVMPKPTLAAGDTADSICKGAPLNKK